MQRFRHGLVVGRFAPFHVGHARLIDTAVASSERVTVLVVSREDDTIPTSVRVGWVRELHPDVHVDAVRRLIPRQISDRSRLRAYCEHLGGLVDRPVDSVFSGPGCGPALAEVLETTWNRIDQGRVVHDVSGRQVRAAPDRFWSMLPAPVRAWYTQRIVVVGRNDARSPELARALAARLSTTVAGCARREFALTRPAADGPAPSAAELSAVFAHQDSQIRSAAAAAPSQWLVCESDELVTRAWHRCRFDVTDVPDRSPSTLVMSSPPRLYVLDGDPERSSGRAPGRLRPRMHDVVRTELARQHEVPWIEVSGDLDERVAQVLQHLPETRVQPLLGPT